MNNMDTVTFLTPTGGVNWWFIISILVAIYEALVYKNPALKSISILRAIIRILKWFLNMNKKPSRKSDKQE